MFKATFSINLKQAVTIIADNESEYQEKVKALTVGMDERIEVKQIVGIIVPVLVEHCLTD
jgi:hypothetical protein